MKVQTGRLDTPYRLLISGTEGIGKTSFAARAKKAVFFAIEQGTSQLDVARARNDDDTPLSSYADVKTQIAWLTTQEHDFETLVLDTLDALDAWITEYVCEIHKWEKGLAEDKAGFGKGHAAVAEEWRRFFASLEKMQRAKRINLISIAHTSIKKYTPPDSEPYDRYSVKLPEKIAALACEWHEGVFFARHVIATARVEKEGKGAKARGYATGERELLTTETAAVKAKNRWCLPLSIPFDREAFDRFEKLRTRDPLVEFEKIVGKAKDEKATREWFARQPDKLHALQRITEKLGEVAA